MADLGDVLGSSIADVGDVPSTGGALVDFAGGRGELVRELAGMSGPPKRSAYRSADSFESARRRWRSASRRVQRYTAGEGRQRRGTTRAPLKPAEQQRVRRAAERNKLAAAVVNGMRARMHARVKFPTPGRKRGRRGPEYRDRTMPAGGPGVYISPDALIPVMEALEEGDADGAAFEFQAAFEEAYGFPNFNVEEVYELKVWPEGTSEP